jgi:hypothetical protein
MDLLFRQTSRTRASSEVDPPKLNNLSLRQRHNATLRTPTTCRRPKPNVIFPRPRATDAATCCHPIHSATHSGDDTHAPHWLRGVIPRRRLFAYLQCQPISFRFRLHRAGKVCWCMHGVCVRRRQFCGETCVARMGGVTWEWMGKRFGLREIQIRDELERTECLLVH